MTIHSPRFMDANFNRSTLTTEAGYRILRIHKAEKERSKKKKCIVMRMGGI